MINNLLRFKFSISGELARFQAGVTMEISCLDAWYSTSDGSLEGAATYIVCGLCRKCCIPEIILRCMQVMEPLKNKKEFNRHI